MLKGEELKEIIKLIDQSSISEFTYEENGSIVSIKKQVEIKQPTTIVQESVQAVPQVQVAQQPVAEATQNDVVEQVEEDENIEEIVSPMVGTFYRKPSPESDPYVDVGDKVSSTTVVCIVEAMKLFNEIEAETTGEIVEVLVGDGELVEFGQPLFKVKKN